MPIVDPKGNEDYWLEGASFENQKNPGSVKTNNEDYWMNGASFEYVVPGGGEGDFLFAAWGIG